MNYIEQLKDFIEILNHTIMKINEYEGGYEEEILFDGEVITILDDMYSYIITSSDEAAGKIFSDEMGLEFKTVAINTREQFINLCEEIEDRVLDLTIGIAQESLYKYNLEIYIEKFAKKLKSEWECFKDVSLKSLPIHITGQDAHNDNGEYDGEVGGTFAPWSRLITVNNARMECKDKDERTARHETIHYMLANSGFPYDDNNALFWFFATIYDANPYSEMDELNQSIFDSFMIYYKNDPEKLKTLLKSPNNINDKVGADLNIEKR